VPKILIRNRFLGWLWAIERTAESEGRLGIFFVKCYVGLFSLRCTKISRFLMKRHRVDHAVASDCMHWKSDTFLWRPILFVSTGLALSGCSVGNVLQFYICSDHDVVCSQLTKLCRVASPSVTVIRLSFICAIRTVALQFGVDWASTNLKRYRDGLCRFSFEPRH
jgi:hypothetical protein